MGVEVWSREKREFPGKRDRVVCVAPPGRRREAGGGRDTSDGLLGLGKEIVECGPPKR